VISIVLLIIIYLSFVSLGLPDSLLGSAWPSMYGSLNVPLHYAGYISMIIEIYPAQCSGTFKLPYIEGHADPSSESGRPKLTNER
jgi:hypothetical protein